MKKLLLFCLLATGITVNAQVAINTDGALPDNSAMLDVKSTTKGMLAPRMTLAQRNAIPSPATGLTIFQTDVAPGLYFNSGTPAVPVWALVGSNAGQWLNNGTSIYYNLGNVGIGTSGPIRKLHVEGDVMVSDYFPFIELSSNAASQNAGLTFSSIGANKGWVYYNDIIGSMVLNADITGWRNDLVIRNDGFIGIGDLAPAARFHVFENSPGYTAAFGVPISSWPTGTNVAIGNDNEDAVLYVGQNQNNKGFLIWQYNATPANGYYSIGTFNGSNNLVLQEYGSSVGVRTAAPAALLHVAEASPGYTGLFGSPISTWNSSTNLSIGDPNGPSVLYIGQSETNKGFLYWNYSATPADAYYNIGTYGGTNPLVLQEAGGNVGIGVTSPVARFQVAESGSSYTGLFGTPISSYTAGTNLSIGDDNANSLMYVGQSASNKGFLIWNYSATASSAYFGIGTYSGNNPVILQQAGGNVGIGTTAPNARLDVRVDNNGYSQLGYDVNIPSYFYHSELETNGDGQTALYGYRTRISQNDGTGYAYYNSNSAIRGYSYWGDVYSFGTTGYNYNDFTRCGGVLGAQQGGSYWGSLGYRNSGGVNYGGYFTSYTSGAGKSTQANTGIGIGAWGDLMGADIHGKVYGIYAEGESYAMYNNGPVYKNNLDVHLQDNGTGTNTVLYTNVSTDATIQTCGYATLSNGRASIDFDPSFAASVSSESPIIITVTPSGNSNGVYLAEVTGAGFAVVENNAGKSNITVNYIAIGKRAGYENPSLSQEVIEAGYTRNLGRGLHNDANTETNGEGLYYENGQLMVGVHPSTLPDPDKPAAETVMPKASVAPVKGAVNVNSSVGRGESDNIRQPEVAPATPSVPTPAGRPGESGQVGQEVSAPVNYPETESSAGGPLKSTTLKSTEAQDDALKSTPSQTDAAGRPIASPKPDDSKRTE